MTQAAPDMNMGALGVSYADIDADMNSTIFSCTVPSTGCHASAAAMGKMVLQPGGGSSMTVLMANYTQITVTRPEVDLTNPTNSNLLLKPLVDPGISHTGQKIGQGINPPTSVSAGEVTYEPVVYTRWLKWIQLGAKFEFQPYSNLNNLPDMSGSAPSDMSTPADMANGGG